MKSAIIATALSSVFMQANLGDGQENGGAPDTGTEQSTFANGPTSASGRIKVAEKDYDTESGVFSIAFADGTQVEVELDSFKQDIVRNLALHGLSQKLGDSYASVKGDVPEAIKRFRTTLEQLQAGEWKKTRAEGEGVGRVTELAEAISRFRSAPLEKAAAAVAKATPEQKKAWQAHPQLKAIIATIRAEKAAAKAAKAQADSGNEGAATDADLNSIEL
ncbi:MAG: hypothetical protein ACKOX6_00805 [Bdellovibrio sp.]